MATHAKSEVEWSFVPLVLGWFGLAEFFFIGVEQTLSNNATTVAILVGPLVALASLVLLWPLYLGAREWVVGYQSVLDRQVGELSRLEAEFFWQFAGMTAPQ